MWFAVFSLIRFLIVQECEWILKYFLYGRWLNTDWKLEISCGESIPKLLNEFVLIIL